MQGYWNDEEQTSQMLRADGPLGECVLCTGDWFRIDEEGFLYFLGRGDEIIKSRGEKISPAEVENALYGIPGVREAAVVGIPDEVLGEAIRAYVVVDPDSGIDISAIQAALLVTLESSMRPKEFVFLDSLPKGENGKISRDILARTDARH